MAVKLVKVLERAKPVHIASSVEKMTIKLLIAQNVTTKKMARKKIKIKMNR